MPSSTHEVQKWCGMLLRFLDLSILGTKPNQLPLLFHMKMMIGCAGMSVRVLAFTTVGVGPYSPLLGVAEALQDPSAQPSHPSSASDTLTALFLGSLFVFVVFAFVATYYLKRRQTLKKELGHLSGEFIMGYFPCIVRLWILLAESFAATIICSVWEQT